MDDQQETYLPAGGVLVSDGKTAVRFGSVFWPVFWAVIAASLVLGLLAGAVSLYALDRATASVEQQLDSVQQDLTEPGPVVDDNELDDWMTDPQ